MLITKLNAIIAVLGVLPTFMTGTTVVVFVTQGGLVLSRDSKTTLRDANFTATGETEQSKFVIIQNRIAVASI
jgi:hypothetical protein